jgi:SAM-dependent methyltransferase
MASRPGSRSYIIRGGVAGRERLAVLREVAGASTRALLERVGPELGERVLDLGCGGGDVTRELARRVGPAGSALGVDQDGVALQIAWKEARAAGLDNIRYVEGDLLAEASPWAAERPFDLAYARFVLSHLADPDGVLSRIHAAIRPGGRLVVEDVDFSGHFCHPPSAAYTRYVDLYRQAARLRNADADIGPSLPARLKAAGFIDADVSIAQTAGWTGPVKLIAALTMEAITDAVAASGLASAQELASLVDELYRLAHDETTVMTAARVIQVWGRKPS